MESKKVQMKILMNLYEIGMRGFRRDNGYVFSVEGVAPSLMAREQGDTVLVVEDESPEVADELTYIYI